MKILMICFVYNEIKYLPHTLDFYRKNGCDIYVLDNFSTDGTWEWLQANNIASHRVNTNESFDLRILQKEILNTLPKLKPDWVIYAGADLYFVSWIPLSKYIDKVDAMGYNQLSMMCWSAFNTGEKHGLPLPFHYYYAAPWRKVVMISRYNESYGMNGDNVSIDNARCYEAKHALAINYGACKPKNEQEIKLSRRKKAWSNGMRPQQGVHYLKGKKRNWLNNKETLTDLRMVPEYKLIKRLFDFNLEYGCGFNENSYNQLYMKSVIYKKHYRDTVYFTVWKYIAEKLLPGDKILDMGCGPGQLARMLYDKSIKEYIGIDFSKVAIEMAKKNVPSFNFIESDLNDIDYSRYPDYKLISTETFEHLENDIELIKNLPKSHIIFSVPDFMCDNHYRTYNSEDYIRKYFNDVVEIREVKAFPIGGNRIIYVVEGQVL